MTTRRHALGLAAGSLLASTQAWSQADLAPATPAPAKSTTGADALAGLDAWLEAQRVAWRAPGVAVALVKDGQVIYAKGFGLRDAAQTLPVNTDTLFRGASTTKAFGAALVAMLVDDGKLAWDAPVTNYIPELRFAGGDEYRSVSLRDLLSHRTGLPRHELLWYHNQALTAQGLVARLPYLEMSAPLRAKYQYCNLTYALAGLVIERVVGLPWQAFAQARLFDPLGMTRLTLSAPDMAQDSNHAIGHTTRGRKLLPVPLRHDPLLGPAGAVNASITEYAKWVQLQLGMGQFGGRRLISTTSMAAMWEPLILTSDTPRAPDYQRGYYGLGWRIDRYRDTVRVAHGGDLNGHTPRVVLLPQVNAGLAILVNHGNHPFANAVTPDLLDRLLGLPPGDNSARAIARRDRAEAAPPRRDVATEPDAEKFIPGTRPSRPLSAYAGTYRHAGYGDMQVTHAVDGLSVRYNDMPAALKHWHFDVFEARTDRPEHGEFNGTKLVFQGDEAGKLAGFSAVLDNNVRPVAFGRVV
jgi:CubicO group peptidase (beta-lactamase class C family)